MRVKVCKEGEKPQRFTSKSVLATQRMRQEGGKNGINDHEGKTEKENFYTGSCDNSNRKSFAGDLSSSDHHTYYLYFIVLDHGSGDKKQCRSYF